MQNGYEDSKEYFPQNTATAFRAVENDNYKGPYPDPSYYGYNAFKTEERAKFLEWYKHKIEQNAVFDFPTEIVEYCRSDVDILCQAFLTFRELLINITGREEVSKDEFGEYCFGGKMQYMKFPRTKQILHELNTLTLKKKKFLILKRYNYMTNLKCKRCGKSFSNLENL
ncbi:hypothetical protein KUTeg_010499 [Tegillarca granosa]|uniref:DNA-directed DNA polymerase n=1 Tax=Tegillarca granosa TaxID=220873 RepID=A0ABQ9F3G7_TEGGR|nr:hypothetical protein KUTeg_010499 [Tegillarca granosa]